MASSIVDMAPYIPSDRALGQSALPDKAVALIHQSARVAGQLSPLTLATLTQHMLAINSYYSNLIEGNATRPHEIRAAQRGDYSGDPAKRDLQLESLAHMQVQQWLRDLKPDLDTVFTTDFIRTLHREFYSRVPESLWAIKDEQGNAIEKIVPGKWRQRNVIVGRHLAPEADNLENLIQRFCATYHPKNFTGDRKLIAIMAAHHRFAWIHPFMDGNGRVGRLFKGGRVGKLWCLVFKPRFGKNGNAIQKPAGNRRPTASG